MKVKIYPTMVSSSSSALIVIAPLLLMAYCFFDFVAAFPGESPDQLWLKKKMEFLRPSPSLTCRLTAISLTPAPGGSFPLQKGQASRILYVTAYGADPTGKTDSTDALLRAISDAFRPQNSHRLMPGIPDLGGAQIHLEGGSYLISRPLRLPASGGGNLMIHSGSLRSTDDFPSDRHLIELWPESVPKLDTRNGDAAKAYGAPSGATFLYENIRLKDLLLDANFRGGGIALINSLRTTIDNCYITHFSTDAILVQGGHESYIHNSFLGQHITAGGDPGERNFSGVGINIMSNDNAVTDVVIFSAAVGILVSGQANTFSGVHCYNKATGWGGVGIYLRLPGLTQTRIVNSYFDYTGIIAEDPVQLRVADCFFLGNSYVLLRSVHGVAKGVSIVGNMFSGTGKPLDIVQLDESKGPRFGTVEQVVVDGNNVKGMTARSTVAKRSASTNGTMWTVDFSDALLFPGRMSHVQYTLQVTGGGFPVHALRIAEGNRVVVEADRPVQGTLHVSVDQSS